VNVTTSTPLPAGFTITSTAPNTAATFFSAPITTTAAVSQAPPDDAEVNPSTDGKKIFKPPSMTIEGIVGGGSRKRGPPGGDNEGGGGKRRWKKNKKVGDFV
jgi:hypothetical protein